MTKEFKDIGVDEILNNEGPTTATIARYERIMQHRTIEAMNGLSSRLDDVVANLEAVTRTIDRVGQLAQDKADAAINASRDAGALQARQQKAMYWLTAVLVVCTVLYTGINLFVAMKMSQGNEIQGVLAEAAREQTAVARESLELQKRSGAQHIVEDQPPVPLQSRPEPKKAKSK